MHPHMPPSSTMHCPLVPTGKLHRLKQCIAKTMSICPHDAYAWCLFWLPRWSISGLLTILHAYMRLEAWMLVGTGMMTTEVAEEVAGMETATTDMMTGAMVTDMMIAAMIGMMILAAKA